MSASRPRNLPKTMGFGGGKIEVAGLMLCEFVCWFPVSGDGD